MNKSGYVSIIGWPNAGKSSLMNALLGLKLSIVGPKPQTTRTTLMGILNEPGYQMIMLDTPGWLDPRDVLQAMMKKSILKAIHDDADILLWVLDAYHWTEQELAWLDILKATGKPVVVAINKIDTESDMGQFGQVKQALTTHIEKTDPNHIKPILSVSAKSKRGLADLKQVLYGLLPEGPAYFPTDQITNVFERTFVTELIRENIMRMFQNEVPHASAVVLEEFSEKPGHKDVIRATIYVETEGQKKILIGDKGRKIKDLGTQSRKDIEANLCRPVFLELRVKVYKQWRKNYQFVASLQGFDN